MRHFIVISVFLVGYIYFLNSCKAKDEAIKQSDLIHRDSMIAILVDIHLAETMIQTIRRDKDSIQTATIQEYYQTIFKQHQITEYQFSESFNYYSKDIEQFDAMYEEMQTILSKMEEETKVETPK